MPWTPSLLCYLPPYPLMVPKAIGCPAHFTFYQLHLLLPSLFSCLCLEPVYPVNWSGIVIMIMNSRINTLPWMGDTLYIIMASPRSFIACASSCSHSQIHEGLPTTPDKSWKASWTGPNAAFAVLCFWLRA